MLSALKFVIGAVSTKNYEPALKHFKLQSGTIRSFNGMLALSSPINIDIDCCPQAKQLVSAIQQCNDKDTLTLSLTPAEQLRIKCGTYKAIVPCIKDDKESHVQPEGDIVQLQGDILTGLKALYPIIGNDASRPWSNGILIIGDNLFVTNNVCLVQYKIATTFPITCNIPRIAIREMLRIDEIPLTAQVNNHSITFHYQSGRWIRAQLLSVHDWPDILTLLDSTPADNLQPINMSIFEALPKLKPFIDKYNRIYFNENGISTSNEPDNGASFDIPNFNQYGIYSHEKLALLEPIAKYIDFSKYPNKVLFTGPSLRGVIIGMKEL